MVIARAPRKSAEQKLVPLISRAAALAGVLAILGHFFIPALMPVVMGLTALIGLTLVALVVAEGRETAWNEANAR